MKGTYYGIIDNSTGVTVDEGILSHNEDVITPGQNTGIKELPSECELHHFKAEGYHIYTFEFDIPYDELKRYDVSY